MFNFIRLQLGDTNDMVGMNMQHECVCLFHQTLHSEIQTHRFPGYVKRSLYRVLHVLQLAMLSRKETLYAEEGLEMESTIRHELMHTAQRKLGMSGTCFHVVSTRAFLRNRIAAKARKSLVEKGIYPNHLTHILSAEIGALLGEGEAGWEMMGLTKPEAISLCIRYRRLMERKHGRGIVRIRELAPILSFAARAA